MASTENAHTVGDLRQMQSLSLESKILMTKQRIQAWYDYWDGYIYTYPLVEVRIVLYC